MKVTSKCISATISPTLINEVFAFTGRRIKNSFQSTVVYVQVGRLGQKLGCQCDGHLKNLVAGPVFQRPVWVSGKLSSFPSSATDLLCVPGQII